MMSPAFDLASAVVSSVSGEVRLPSPPGVALLRTYQICGVESAALTCSGSSKAIENAASLGKDIGRPVRQSNARLTQQQFAQSYLTSGTSSSMVPWTVPRRLNREVSLGPISPHFPQGDDGRRSDRARLRPHQRPR